MILDGMSEHRLGRIRNANHAILKIIAIATIGFGGIENPIVIDDQLVAIQTRVQIECYGPFTTDF